ncbi:MAG: hypothetical protein AB1634_17470 [Thermodesulfobacteriota bacterium]
MAQEYHLIERRRHRRFVVNGLAYTVNCTKPGLITNISLGGLAVRYLDRKQWADEPFESCRLDLIVGDNDLVVRDVPVRLIADVLLGEDGSSEETRRRRRSLAFCQLDRQQTQGLAQIIERFTMPSVYVPLAGGLL